MFVTADVSLSIFCRVLVSTVDILGNPIKDNIYESNGRYKYHKNLRRGVKPSNALSHKLYYINKGCFHKHWVSSVIYCMLMA